MLCWGPLVTVTRDWMAVGSTTLSARAFIVTTILALICLLGGRLAVRLAMPHLIASRDVRGGVVSDDVSVRVDGVWRKFGRNLKRSLWYGVKDTVADLAGRDCGDQELRRGEFRTIDDVSFEIRRGECPGLIGRNGAGNISLLKIPNGLIKPNRGRVGWLDCQYVGNGRRTGENA